MLLNPIGVLLLPPRGGMEVDFCEFVGPFKNVRHKDYAVTTPGSDILISNRSVC